MGGIALSQPWLAASLLSPRRPKSHNVATPRVPPELVLAGEGRLDVNVVQSVAIDRDAVSDLSETASAGWPVDPRERCDFYHRIRVFSPDVAEWRKRTVGRLLKEGTLFRGVAQG